MGQRSWDSLKRREARKVREAVGTVSPQGGEVSPNTHLAASVDGGGVPRQPPVLLSLEDTGARKRTGDKVS